MAGNSLISLKSTDKGVIKPCSLKELISTVSDLTKVYFEGKNVEYNIENVLDVKIPVDENKFMSVLINLIKNASEEFNKEYSALEMVSKKEKNYVSIKTESEGDFVIIKIANNAGRIIEPEKIFNEGYTTKSSGRGLGLIICKKSIEEMYGKLELVKNSDEEVVFAVKIGKVG